MNIAEIKTRAKSMGIKPVRMKKDSLIQAIQVAEGNFDCFGTATDYCDQLECSFRDDCLSPQK